MSEKRFKLNDKGSFILEDGDPLKPLGDVVHKLNEQQAKIEQLEKDKAILKERLRECGMRLDRFNCR